MLYAYYNTEQYYDIFYLCFNRCQARPSMFAKNSSARKKKNQDSRIYSYDRDIICFPESFSGKDGLVKIPRQSSVRDYLASNHLIGKIRLNSNMSEALIMNEVRSVFEVAMSGNPCFPFRIMQMSGGSSKTLCETVVSSSFRWTASAIADRNAKVPIYILANEELNVVSC